MCYLPSTSAYLAVFAFLFPSWPSTTSQTIHSISGAPSSAPPCTLIWYLFTFLPHLYSASSCDPPHVTSGAQSLCSRAPCHLFFVSPIHPIHRHPSPSHPLSPSPCPSSLNRPHHYTLTPSLPLWTSGLHSFMSETLPPGFSGGHLFPVLYLSPPVYVPQLHEPVTSRYCTPQHLCRVPHFLPHLPLLVDSFHSSVDCFCLRLSSCHLRAQPPPIPETPSALVLVYSSLPTLSCTPAPISLHPVLQLSPKHTSIPVPVRPPIPDLITSLTQAPFPAPHHFPARDRTSSPSLSPPSPALCSLWVPCSFTFAPDSPQL